VPTVQRRFGGWSVSSVASGVTRPSSLTGPYRFYDWDFAVVHSSCVRRSRSAANAHRRHYFIGASAILYGGNFAVRREALDRIGFDRSINFMAKTPQAPIVAWFDPRRASAGSGRPRRYRAMGKRKGFGLYVRNFWSEILRHRPADRSHIDVRA
jgi:hypothetical protein